MPTLDKHIPGLRVLIVGDPGSGKTSAIGKLAEHKQQLFIADFDNNLNPMTKFVNPEAFENIHYETLVDKVHFNQKGLPVVRGIPKAWPRFTELSSRWIDSETKRDYGAPESWEKDSWFVIDSATTMGNAAINWTKHDRRTMGKRRSLPDWGDAIERVEGSLQIFAGARINFICTAHLARLSMEDVTESAEENGKAIDRPVAARRLPPNAHMRYPVTLGQKLPPRIGGYFNLVLQAQRIGSGPSARRVIRTVPEEDVDIKVPLPPKTVPPEVPIDQLWTILQHFIEK